MLNNKKYLNIDINKVCKIIASFKWYAACIFIISFLAFIIWDNNLKNNYQMNLIIGKAKFDYLKPNDPLIKTVNHFISEPKNSETFATNFTQAISHSNTQLNLSEDRWQAAFSDLKNSFGRAQNLKISLHNYLSQSMVNISETSKRLYPRNFPLLLQIKNNSYWHIISHSHNPDTFRIIFHGLKQSLPNFVEALNSHLRQAVVSDFLSRVSLTNEMYESMAKTLSFDSLQKTYNHALIELMPIVKKLNQHFPKLKLLADNQYTAHFGLGVNTSSITLDFIRINEIIFQLKTSLASIPDSNKDLEFLTQKLEAIENKVRIIDLKRQAQDQISTKLFTTMPEVFFNHWKGRYLQFIKPNFESIYPSDEEWIQASYSKINRYLLPSWLCGLILSLALTILSCSIFSIFKYAKN